MPNLSSGQVLVADIYTPSLSDAKKKATISHQPLDTRYECIASQLAVLKPQNSRGK